MNPRSVPLAQEWLTDRFNSKIIIDRDELRRVARSLRSEGRKIVFANGAFDLIHVGHVRFLIEAASHGDVLVVGVNSDESIRQYKGPGRPMQPLAERLEIISIFRPVTIVTCFDEPTCDALLEVVHPHFHARGPDYTPQNLPEYPTLQRLGIELVNCGDPKTHSSTNLVQRLRRGD